MLRTSHIKNISILLIDTHKEFNKKLTVHLKQYGYKVIQAFCFEEGLEKAQKYSSKLHLVVLNIDQASDKHSNIFHQLQEIVEAKTIILSEEDIGSKRESYFKQGILDYYVVSPKIHHISHDIHQAIQSLYYNKGETILVVESSKSISEILKKILEKRSYKVFTANSAKDGIAVLKENSVSVLILDMELPDIHGLEVLEGLKDLYLLHEFNVLATSSINNDPSLIRDALKGGAKNFLRKPFLFEEFLLKVDLLVKSSRDRQTLQEQKREIENTLRRFQELLHATINAMFVFEDNVCIDCNKEAVQLFELKSMEELLGKNIIEIFKDTSKEHQEELIDNTIDHYFEDIIQTNSDNRYNVQIKERNVVIDKKLLKIISIMDITQIKRNEKIISQQSKMASMGEMIGNIAHQWRQPLTAISIAASGIKLNYELEIEEREETMQELDSIVQNTQFLSNTIEDFQNYLKNNRDIKQFFIEEVIDKTLNIIHANLESKDIRVIKNIQKDVQVEGIQNDLIQILLNIVNNSVDALKHLEVEKDRIILFELTLSDHDVTIDIFDSAGGVSKNIIEHIFDPYFTTKHQAQGTGLGLYMTHQIIEKIQGKIEVHNQKFFVGEKEYFGAKFFVTIPLVFGN
jgi:signal transduction histidine kinase/DNA-binding response OmpR family regulator